MADMAQGGAPASSPINPGQSTQQTVTRARPGDLDLGSAGYGQDNTQITLQNPGLVDRPLDPNDPFSPITSEDARSQALAMDDSVQGEVVDGQDEQMQAANALTESDVRRMLDEYRAWADGDDLADQLMQKFVVATIDGKRYRIPVQEAVQGYQRNQDYSNKLREVYQLRAELQQQQQGLQAFMRDLDDGQSFLDAMQRVGKFDGFSKAAMIYGTQLDAERRMTPQQRQVYQHMREMRARAQRVELENARLRQQMQVSAQQQPAAQATGPDYNIYMQQLNNLIPRVSERIGFEPTPLAMREFETHFMNMLPSLNGGDLSSDFVETCMRAAQESVAAHMSAGYVQPEPEQPGRSWSRDQSGRFAGQQRRQSEAAPPVGRAAALPGPAAQRQPRGRIGDFDRAVRGRA